MILPMFLVMVAALVSNTSFGCVYVYIYIYICSSQILLHAPPLRVAWACGIVPASVYKFPRAAVGIPRDAAHVSKDYIIQYVEDASGPDDHHARPQKVPIVYLISNIS
jgi:hypothetical protein